MNIRKFVPILVAIALIAFGMGFLSLKYNDNYKFVSFKSGNLIDIKSKDEIVKIGTDGIEVKDGNDHVVIGWDGIKVKDGKEEVSIGWDGIKVKDGNKSGFSIDKSSSNWNWFGISSNKLKWETVDEEKFSEIDGINSIAISSPFIDVKVTSEDRDDVRIRYYGKMKSNVLPTLKVEKKSNNLDIKLESNTNSYSVMDSDVVLEVFIPKSFSENISTSTSSGNIYMKDLIVKDFSISSSSGDLELENLEGKALNLSTSSGDIKLEDSIGEINVTSSSGDVFLDNEKVSGDMKISTSSGDVSIIFSNDASYNIKGSTSSGDFYSSINMNILENEKGRFRATIGSGEKSIDISTSSGDVEFNK